jgi:predicted metal-dependent peptidase
MQKRNPPANQAKAARDDAWKKIAAHPIFGPLQHHARIIDSRQSLCPIDGWLVVTTNGFIHVHPTRRAEIDEWVALFAHALLHLGLGHLEKRPNEHEWNAACDCVVTRFLIELKIGRLPQDLRGDLQIGQRDELALYKEFCTHGIPPDLAEWGTAGSNHADMLYAEIKTDWQGRSTNWTHIFSAGILNAVDDAVRIAGGHERLKHRDAPAESARQWFINSYPLLGALAAAFKIISDNVLCARLEISVAAVDTYDRVIYINPAAGLDPQELRFVMAHELLHVGLRHDIRRQGRDPYLWNVACDYVINGWLIEMGLGILPRVGGLYDPELKGLGAEGVYDRIVTDLRRYRRLATLRGIGACDIIESRDRDWWNSADGADLDDFYRGCLSQGLEYHSSDRGLLPKGLIEEIRALLQPPIPWDVKLARWFDHHFATLEKHRSYSRVSRRQSATPDIPRPRYTHADDAMLGRTFGVILDTSGSMKPETLAKALGAIASYSASRDVPLVRIIFCDAAPYDAGYMSPDAIAGNVRVQGRGGTILQSAVELLERAPDFPKDGPILLITDGKCDRLRISRPHAFLMPQGASLPFLPIGEMFYIP